MATFARSPLREPNIVNRKAFFLAVAFVGWTCASPGGGGRPSSSRDQISRDEIETTSARNAYEIVEALRPQWLRARGPVGITDPTPNLPDVYIDGTPFGDIEALRTINVDNVQRIHFWGPGPAMVRYGEGHPRGIIEVIVGGD